jgi:2-polyprenyl-3-methyl-5-hydroxy-6-metoxy-1,4-benzoquinol methylase
MPGNKRILDIGCSGGLHALEFAKRGFSITGVDIEPSAIELAKKRSADNRQKIEYMIIDIEKDELSSSGKFNLIYSIGNVLSHVIKNNLIYVLRKIRGWLDDDGIFLFDVLINSIPFQEEILPDKDDNQIIWKRKIDEKPD